MMDIESFNLETLIRDSRKYNPEKYSATNGWEGYFPLDYGTFPEYDDFDAMVEFISEDGSRRIKFENDSYVGTCEFTAYELWNELDKVWKQAKLLRELGYKKSVENELWVENLLKRLGWEWVK